MELNFRTLNANEIECRIGMIKDNGLTLLLYKDARCDMNVLDEAVGALNWSRTHIRENANCIVSIWDNEKSQWISKEDTGTESNTEAEKGLASDSFKRACVNWGIGRELYTAPFVWIPSDKCTIKNSNGRLQCFDKFKVINIAYNDKREIVKLSIKNEKTGIVCFEYGVEKRNAKTTRQDKKSWENSEPIKCVDCGTELAEIQKKDGTTMSVNDVRDFSYKKYGRVLCAECMKRQEQLSNFEKETA